MRQYCSSRMWSSIQPLPGVCSSGWFRKKRKRPPGASTRATSAMASSTLVDVLEHQAGDDGVERLVGERQSGRRRPGRRPDLRPARRPRRSGPRSGRCRPPMSRRVERRRAGRSGPRRCRRRARVRRPARCSRGHRQDLLLVLGVGAVGEAVLPPLGVVFPQVDGVDVHRLVDHGPLGPWILAWTASATGSGSHVRP